MVTSGFSLVREGQTGTVPADIHLFGGPVLTMNFIDGDGLNPNSVHVETSTVHNLEVGDFIRVLTASGGSYALDIFNEVTEIISTVQFRYLSTNHASDSTNDGTIQKTDPYSLPDDTPDTVPFIHLTLGLASSSLVKVTRDNINFIPIANNESLIGDIFRSFTLRKGDFFNVTFSASTTVDFAYLLREE